MSRSLIGVLLLALALRIGAAIACEGHAFSADEAHWQRMAEAVWRHGLLSTEAGFFRPPLYPLLIACVYGVLGYEPLFVRLLQAVLSAATCLMPYGLARTAYGERAGLYAALLAACHPLFIFFSGLFMAETLLLACTGLALWQMQRVVDRPNAPRAVGLGVVLGLGALCKPVLLIWVPLLFVVLWKARIGRGICGAKYMTLVGLMLVLTIFPWTLRNKQVSGHPVPISTNLGINLLVGHEPSATGSYSDEADYWHMVEEIAGGEKDPVLRDALVARHVLQGMVTQPLRTLRLGAIKVASLWIPLGQDASTVRAIGLGLMGALVLLLGAIGLWHMRHSPVGWSALSLLVALVGVHALFFAHIRFRLPIDLALIAPVACWLANAMSRGESCEGS
ncbi:MAG: glycosyltransferase family 39 protein [Candidatus Latescibacterota bacterium]|nr:glycosyltransferase family 39 protein [Candidatus Latescibacterota bacterium]